MYIHFYLPSDSSTQKRLHPILRKKIRVWQEQALVRRAILTYHFDNPPDSDYLQLCLDIPTVANPRQRKVILSDETKRQMPAEIAEYVRGLCRENRIEEQYRDYWVEVEDEKRKKGREYYDNIPLNDLVKYASIGTQIAFETMEKSEQGGNWDSIEGTDYVLARLNEELGRDYSFRHIAYHFVRNPLQYAGSVTDKICTDLRKMESRMGARFQVLNWK